MAQLRLAHYRHKFLNQNPYQAPIGTKRELKDSIKPNGSVEFRSLVMKWEKYRLIYNVALVATTILGMMAFQVSPLQAGLWIIIFLGACVANILFMLGPSFDGYLQVAGLRHPLCGLFIFGCGTLLAVILAALTVASF